MGIKSFEPTALSVPLINLVWLRLACVVASGGGSILALSAETYPGKPYLL